MSKVRTPGQYSVLHYCRHLEHMSLGSFREMEKQYIQQRKLFGKTLNRYVPVVCPADALICPTVEQTAAGPAPYSPQSINQ